MRLNSAAILLVIEEDLARAVGMTRVSKRSGKNDENSFTREDAETVLKLVNDYAAARLLEYQQAEMEKLAAARAAQARARLRRSA